MTSPHFDRPLGGRIARSLGTAQGISSSELNTLWNSFGPEEESPRGNKQDKANGIVGWIRSRPNADAMFLELLNEVYYFDGKGDLRRNEDEFKPLLASLLSKQFVITNDEGFKMPTGSVTSVSETTNSVMTPTPFAATPTAIKADWKPMKKIGDSRSVFIVHGRNIEARNQVAKFLKHLEASPISWTDAAHFTAKSAPTTMEIIKAGMDRAQAIVVIFSPDDRAMLKEGFHKDHEALFETSLTGQARQNVILEAGMALALAPERTVLVRLGHVRPISDIEGINWIDLDDSWDNRARLKNALIHSGVIVKNSVNLNDDGAGSFEAVSTDSK